MRNEMTLRVEQRQIKGRWEYVPDSDQLYKRGDSVCIAAFARLGLNTQMNIKPLRPPRGLPRLGDRNQLSREVAETLKAAEPEIRERRTTTWYTFTELFQENWDKFSREEYETDFSIDTIARLRQLSSGQSLDHWRIVVWFDPDGLDSLEDLRQVSQYTD